MIIDTELSERTLTDAVKRGFYRGAWVKSDPPELWLIVDELCSLFAVDLSPMTIGQIARAEKRRFTAEGAGAQVALRAGTPRSE